MQVLSVAGGADHTCAVLTDGTVQCWGDNAQSQRGEAGPQITTPGPSSEVNLLLNGRKMVEIDGQGHHTCGVVDDGNVICWGQNHKAQSGAPITQTETFAQEITFGFDPTQCTTDRLCLDWNLWSLPSTQLYLDDEVCGDGNDNDLDGDVDEGCGPDGDPDNDQILAVVDNCPADHNPDQLDLNNDGIGDVCQPAVERTGGEPLAVGGTSDNADGEFGCMIQEITNHVYCWGRNTEGQTGVDPALWDETAQMVNDNGEIPVSYTHLTLPTIE